MCMWPGGQEKAGLLSSQGLTTIGSSASVGLREVHGPAGKVEQEL